MIESATIEDCQLLTAVAFEAKGHWRYPADYLEVWRNELTVSKDYISRNWVRKKIVDGTIVAFYSVVEIRVFTVFGEVEVETGFWLDHMFVRPSFHGQGIGTELICDMKTRVPVRTVNIFVDPNAEGFYKKIGSTFVRLSKSSIPGRMIPVHKLEW